MATSSGYHSANDDVMGMGCGSWRESACSTPFVSAPSSPDPDPAPFSAAAGCFYSAPASPARGGGGHGTAEEYSRELGFDFDFDFFSRCPSPVAAVMSSADELFHNGQIRPTRLASFLLHPQALPPLSRDAVVPPSPPQPPSPEPAGGAVDDERGRLRSRSVQVQRRYRSLSPFRAPRWLSSPASPAPAAAKSVEPASASRSTSSASTASSSASSSSPRGYRWWGFLKVILHRSKSDGGKQRPPLPSNPSAPAPKRSPSPSPAASRGRGRARRSSVDAHSRQYDARRSDAEDMRRRTFLPYRRQVFLLGYLGIGSRDYGAMHGLAAAAPARNSTSVNTSPALPP